MKEPLSSGALGYSEASNKIDISMEETDNAKASSSYPTLSRNSFERSVTQQRKN